MASTDYLIVVRLAHLLEDRIGSSISQVASLDCPQNARSSFGILPLLDLMFRLSSEFDSRKF
jgi:hypothetical protein